MPFIYGAVIAYLLKPVCNTIEGFLRRFIPEKMNGLINALSVALTILFGLLLVYALVMMMVPQLITSVTTLYYTAQANITKFMNWANHLEFIEMNDRSWSYLNGLRCPEYQSDTWIKNTLLPSMQNTRHPKRCSRWCAERGDGGQEPDHRHHRSCVYAGQPQAVRPAGQDGAATASSSPAGRS